MLEVIFLGTNGWYDTKTGNTISILIKSLHYNIVLDAGNGIAKLERYINDGKPVYLFISHFHLDHIIGLHTISMNTFPAGLWIMVQDGSATVLNQFVDAPFTIPFRHLPFITKILEVPAQTQELPFTAVFLPLVHASPTLGMRLELDGKIIAFCPDTGYCENAIQLGRNADLLIRVC